MNSLTRPTPMPSVAWPQLAGNALLFQGLWFAAIFNYAAIAGACLLGLLAQGLRQRWSSVVWTKLAILAGLGMAADSTFAALGWYRFDESVTHYFLLPIPLWLMFLWLGFVCTLPLSLQWTLRKVWLSAVVYSVAGVMSYSAGRALGALEFENSALVATGGLWALVGALSAVLVGPGEKDLEKG